jgi:hypothetical protein
VGGQELKVAQRLVLLLDLCFLEPVQYPAQQLVV